MKIIIIGCGKVGRALTEQLVSENHNITVIDTNPKKIQTITEDLDVMGISGNGAGITTLLEAGIAQADILISVTGSDELNLLCCLIARKAGHCQTVARVRNPMYSQEIDFIKAQMGVSMIINPELTTAREIEKLLRFPAASKIDTFANGRIYLVKLKVDSQVPLDGVPVMELPSRSGSDVLVCAVERNDTVYIPDGNFILRKDDAISFVASKEQVHRFFKHFFPSCQANTICNDCRRRNDAAITWTKQSSTKRRPGKDCGKQPGALRGPQQPAARSDHYPWRRHGPPSSDGRRAWTGEGIRHPDESG